MTTLLKIFNYFMEQANKAHEPNNWLDDSTKMDFWINDQE